MWKQMIGFAYSSLIQNSAFHGFQYQLIMGSCVLFRYSEMSFGQWQPCMQPCLHWALLYDKDYACVMLEYGIHLCYCLVWWLYWISGEFWHVPLVSSCPLLIAGSCSRGRGQLISILLPCGGMEYPCGWSKVMPAAWCLSPMTGRLVIRYMYFDMHGFFMTATWALLEELPEILVYLWHVNITIVVWHSQCT